MKTPLVAALATGLMALSLAACSGTPRAARTTSVPRDGGVHTSDKVFDDALWASDVEASVSIGVKNLTDLKGIGVDADLKDKARSVAAQYDDQGRSLRDQLSYAYRSASQDYSQAETAEERAEIRRERNRLVDRANYQLERVRTINSLIEAFARNPTDASFAELQKSILKLNASDPTSGPASRYLEKAAERQNAWNGLRAEYVAAVETRDASRVAEALSRRKDLWPRLFTRERSRRDAVVFENSWPSLQPPPTFVVVDNAQRQTQRLPYATMIELGPIEAPAPPRIVECTAAAQARHAEFERTFEDALRRLRDSPGVALPANLRCYPRTVLLLGIRSELSGNQVDAVQTAQVERRIEVWTYTMLLENIDRYISGLSDPDRLVFDDQ